jgi:hypothetical protein
MSMPIPTNIQITEYVGANYMREGQTRAAKRPEVQSGRKPIRCILLREPLFIPSLRFAPKRRAKQELYFANLARKYGWASPWTANRELSEIEFGKNTDELLLGQWLQTHMHDVIRKWSPSLVQRNDRSSDPLKFTLPTDPLYKSETE